MNHHDISLIEIGEKAGAESERNTLVAYLSAMMEAGNKRHSEYWVLRQLVADIQAGKHVNPKP